MNAEIFHDAISLLPEELLQDVDALRQKKRTPWKGVIAAAACVCLLMGAWALHNGGIKAESGSSAPNRAEDAGAGMEHSQDCSQISPMEAIIVEVQNDRIIVLPGSTYTSIAEPVTVMLTELENIPTLTKDQRIYIYYTEKTTPLFPYQIEVIDE